MWYKSLCSLAFLSTTEKWQNKSSDTWISITASTIWKTIWLCAVHTFIESIPKDPPIYQNGLTLPYPRHQRRLHCKSIKHSQSSEHTFTSKKWGTVSWFPTEHWSTDKWKERGSHRQPNPFQMTQNNELCHRQMVCTSLQIGYFPNKQCQGARFSFCTANTHS